MTKDQAYIGRQPIVDRQQNIIGYELLFRHSATATDAKVISDLQAGTNVLINTLSNIGTDLVLGDKLAFINMSNAMLESDFVELLPADRVVLEIVSGTVATPTLLNRCRQLRSSGYRLALDNYHHSADQIRFLDLVNFIKWDAQQLSNEKISAMLPAIEKYPAKWIAEKIETQKEFQTFKVLGFHYFQGYYFAQPETLSAKVINPSHTHVLEVLNKVRNNCDIGDVEISFKRDVALSFKLLRYINSVGFGLSCEIQSIRHALTILGYKQLYRWATLLLVTAGEDSTPPVLIKTAITRGRLTELLGKNYLEKQEWDNLFIVGVFSLLDVMLDMTMETVLEHLNLSEPIADALSNREGIYGPFLALAEACENTTPEDIHTLAESLQLEPEQVNKAHLSALAWVENIGV